ncbi:FadD3 family acyl-CoA ligase [Nocardioides nitrophenolicus]|uniref:FadD3 family acyl-CoA ligase n=1 Tax=Nocardioides nitrophenolicus TaxID=60489 RepID=UPI001959C6DF|nr:FadD3 family acyl-CoA ligase [Nocardioides nitrophenolicus]MBM7517163.1 acyl-CoA synthetase (AMP-forming)/AMP-acid ligase II [Nocardioides nitrophenolicus]
MAARTIPALLAHGAATHGAHPAIVDGSTTISYEGLRELAVSAARSYLALGVEPGDRVAIWAPNRWEFVVALLGAEYVGASVVPLNTRYRGQEAQVILERSRAVVLVLCDSFLGTDYSAMLAEAEGELPHLRTRVDMASAGLPGTLGWADFLALGEQVPAAEVERLAAEVTPDTVCDILFTSGTTGVPKGVMSTHAQTIGVAEVWADGASLSPADRYAIVNPFFHGFGYKAGVITSLTAGTTIYPVPTFDPVALMQLVQDERITVLPGAPTIFITLLNHPRRTEFDLSSLRFSIAGAASVPETLFEQMHDVLGFETVYQAYGLTECVVATTSRHGEDPRHIAETTGPPVPGIEARIVGGDGQEVPVGEEGEIWLRGANVMLGYFEDPESTAAAIDPDGWFHTGDIGRLDEHGCVKITDRIKDMFITGGFNVYPAEIENVLAAHPAVMESAVIGVPDDRMGAVGAAHVVLRPGTSATREELIAWVRERLANFKVPRDVVLEESLPRNASGKVLKTELRQG